MGTFNENIACSRERENEKHGDEEEALQGVRGHTRRGVQDGSHQLPLTQDEE